VVLVVFYFSYDCGAPFRCAVHKGSIPLETDGNGEHGIFTNFIQVTENMLLSKVTTVKNSHRVTLLYRVCHQFE